MKLKPGLSIFLQRNKVVGQHRICMTSKIRIAGDEEFEVRGTGDMLMIGPTRGTVGLREQEIMLLGRLLSIVSTLGGKLDATDSEWKSIVENALGNYVEGFVLEIGPDLNEN